MKKYALIIHGGCGAVDKFSPAEQKKFLKSLEKIVLKGEALLKAGGDALDVAEACVKMLENDPIFNAGRGSVLNENGDIEMDASIMDGRNLRAGAVAGLFTAKNPIEVARRVMEKTPHVMLVGKGAEKFVKDQRLNQKPKEYFLTAHRQEQLRRVKRQGQVSLDHGSSRQKAHLKTSKLGTVGAVVYDKKGNIAAATSTGGMTNKMVGRTGDSPLIGCGTYADNESCGVSCTGRGEDFIRTGLAKFVSDLVAIKKWNAPKAAKFAAKYFAEKVAGYGGFIMIDKKGRVADAYTTEGLIRGYVQQGKKPVCKLFN